MKIKKIIQNSLIVALFLASFSSYSQTSYAYITNFNDSTISVIDLNKLEKIKDIVTGKNPHGVDVSPDGKWVAP